MLLAELLHSEQNYIYKYHEHQTLLENKEAEELNEEERKAAWDEFENEKTMRVTSSITIRQGMTGMQQPSKLEKLRECLLRLMHIFMRQFH